MFSRPARRSSGQSFRQDGSRQRPSSNSFSSNRSGDNASPSRSSSFGSSESRPERSSSSRSSSGYSGSYSSRSGGYSSDRGSSSYSSDRNSGGGSYNGSRSGGSYGGSRGGGGSGGRKQKQASNVHISTYTQIATAQDLPVMDKIDFSSFKLNDRVLQSLEARGFHSATLIQSQAIPAVLEGKDLVAISQTGSGKTGSFLIPIMNQTLEDQDNGKLHTTLIIAPTRELAFQIDKELQAFEPKRLKIFSQVCIGGTFIGDQIRNLRRTNQFIIGTPGRLVDLTNRGVLKLEEIDTVVLDEMDRMLEMGFIDDISWIMERVKPTRQALYFSATLNKGIKPILQRLSPDATYIQSEQIEPSKFVEQTMIEVFGRDAKMEMLAEILKEEGADKALIFVNTKQMAEEVADYLAQLGHQTDYLHGDKTQGSRLRTLRGFKEIKKGVLAATDVAARGLDVHDITHVINFDEPKTDEDYIHRIGRTGRNGKFGKAITLVSR